MSEDISGEDTEATQNDSRLRGLAGAVGTLAGLSIAGCSESGSEAGDSQSTTTDSGPTPAGTNTTPDQESSADTPAQSTPTPTPTPNPTPTPTPTPSDAECRDRLSQAESELSTVESELSTVRSEIDPTERRRENLSSIIDLWTPPSESDQQNAKEVGTAARDAVVVLELGGSGLATGWYVDDHHIVTNAHNIQHHGDRVRSVSAWTLDGDERATEVIDFVESLRPDIAVLHTEKTAPSSLTLGTDVSLSQGETLVQVGNPGSIGNWVLSAGNVIDRFEMEDPQGNRYGGFSSTVPGVSGVSGSPVLNMDGTVVGLTNAGSPLKAKSEDEAPLPAASVVYDRPIASLSTRQHVGVDVVAERYREWTGR